MAIGEFCRINVMIKKLFANTQHSEYWWQDALFVGAVSAAVIAHVLFLSVQFGMPQENNTSTKEIAISIRPSEDEIKDAEIRYKKALEKQSKIKGDQTPGLFD